MHATTHACMLPHMPACYHLSCHMQLNGVGQHDNCSKHPSCNVSHCITHAVVVKDITCTRGERPRRLYVRSPQPHPSYIELVLASHTLSVTLKGEEAQCSQHAEEEQ